MLILSPNSVCDVCLEGYNKRDNVPYAIECGHIFCLSCLKSLARPCCPLCRALFDLDDARRLHIDKVNSVPPTPVRRPVVSDDMDDPRAHAQDLLSQVTAVALGGQRPALEVRDLIIEVQQWLLTQPDDEHLDLRSAHRLLYKYIKNKEDKTNYQSLKISYHEMQAAFEKVLRKSEDMKTSLAAAQVEIDEMKERRIEDKTRAIDRERQWKDKLEQIDLDWRGKYERCLDENREYREIIRKIRPDLISTPPKDVRNIYADTPRAEPMVIEERRVSTSPPKNSRQSIFQLSPVPSTLPMPSLSSVQATFHSLAEDSDIEEIRKDNPFVNRSAQPIPIKTHHRHGSLLSRHDSDTIPRSIPRSLVDVHMASCSSSPTVADFKHPADRHSDTVSQSVTMHDTSSLSRRSTGASRRPSISSLVSHVQDPEGQRMVWKAQLCDLLDQEPSEDEALRRRRAEPERKISPSTTSPPRPLISPRRATSPETKRTSSPESSAPVTRQSSPVSATSPSEPASASSEKEKVQNSLLQRPKETISRASTAAMQAERERERARQEKLMSAGAPQPPVPMPAPPYTGSVLREPQRDISNTYYQHQQHQQHPQHPQPQQQLLQQSQPQMGRPIYPRRPSDALRTKPVTAHPINPSGLTRSLWTAEGQHTTQRA